MAVRRVRRKRDGCSEHNDDEAVERARLAFKSLYGDRMSDSDLEAGLRRVQFRARREGRSLETIVRDNLIRSLVERDTNPLPEMEDMEQQARRDGRSLQAGMLSNLRRAVKQRKPEPPEPEPEADAEPDADAAAAADAEPDADADA